MRVESAIKNVKSIMLVSVINIILQFIVRMVFINILPIEYLGINGLFTNILAMLSLAELGIGSAIVYSLYKPLAIGDTETIKSIMRIFKKAYIYIGLIILIVGAFITPWLKFFINGPSNIDGLGYIYIIFLIDTGISYFYSYKRNLLIADQRQYVANYYKGVFRTLRGLGQIVLLLLTHSYWAFIIIRIVATFLENYTVALKADKIYPILKDKNIKPLAKEIKNDIVKNTKAMLFHKIGSIAVFGTVNLIISKFVGLVAVGLYSNYYLIISSIQGISGPIFNSLTASIGNLNTLASDEKKVEIFKILYFMTAWLAFYISIGLYVMINPLIEVWLGNKYICAETMVVILVFNFYLGYMRKPALIFRNAMGLFWNNRYMPLAETLINLFFGIYLVQLYGIEGALLGMTISSILMPFWVEPYIVMKNGLKFALKKYYAYYILFAGITLIISIGMKHLYGMLFLQNSIFSLIVGVILCTILPNTIWIAIFHKTNEFQYVFKIVKSKILRKEKSRDL